MYSLPKVWLLGVSVDRFAYRFTNLFSSVVLLAPLEHVTRYYYCLVSLFRRRRCLICFIAAGALMIFSFAASVFLICFVAAGVSLRLFVSLLFSVIPLTLGCVSEAVHRCRRMWRGTQFYGP